MVERPCARTAVSRARGKPRVATRSSDWRSHHHYGYRRIDAQLHRDAMAVNRKRALRVMRDDNRTT